MKLYNTLTRQTDELTFQQESEVKIYTCGPTVYDYAHIGHWFNYVRMDTLVRTLKLQGFNPTWVMNITDVGHLVSDADEGEDKLEKGARREGKTAWEVAEFYTQDFLECMNMLHITTPTHIVKATDHITEQIELIRQLEEKGFTYTIDDGVYYDTGKFEGYAAFARLDLDDQQEGARVAVNEQKRNASDFALWKFSPTDHQRDMEWDSPWGTGFPGWHIECSAMSMKYLGATLDIHTGGIDHIPVHHTNEIAQSEAATGKRFANYWMHSNHVMVDGNKISKSLGNGIRLQEILAKGIPPEAVRLHVLESQYRSQSQFSFDSLISAHNRLKNWQAVAVLRYQSYARDGALSFSFHEAETHLIELLANDLDTPSVLAFVSSIFTQIETALVNAEFSKEFESLLETLDTALGLGLMKVPNISDEQRELIRNREQARIQKDWSASDTFRESLATTGLGLRDTAHGPIWYWL